MRPYAESVTRAAGGAVRRPFPGKTPPRRGQNPRGTEDIRGPLPQIEKKGVSTGRSVEGREAGQEIFVWDAGKKFEKGIAGGEKFL